jgi:large subunit ribosomal protein L18e
MARENKKTNPQLQSLIQSLKQLSYEKQTPLWKDVALRLEKPLRNWPEVNLDRINRVTQDKEIALIPGKVLSGGMLSKKLSIAAWSFSEQAKEKIKKAGGKSLTLEELLKQNPDGKNIRIVG